jgi:hypothetical protein
MQCFTFTYLLATISLSTQFNNAAQLNISKNFLLPEESYSSYKQKKTLADRHGVI